MTTRDRHRLRLHAARVAVAATAVVVACYLVCAVALSLFVAHRLNAEADGRLSAALALGGRLALGGTAAEATTPSSQRQGDLDDAPVFLWHVDAGGTVSPLTVGAPSLPRQGWGSAPATITIGSVPFRVEAIRSGSGWVAAGQSVADIPRVRSLLVLPELLFGIALAAATFGGAMVVGLRASAPLDLVRRRQAEFTGDASHELRTPLSVVEAEVDLALRRRREPEEYEEVLRRVAVESKRLRRIVDDLLWLARLDGGALEGGEGQRADVGAIAGGSTDRFAVLSTSRGVTLTFLSEGQEASVVQAPAEWIERLAGVLIDNACKFAGEGGVAEVRVRTAGGRVTLCVDDSGPGIPPEERTAVFDRFRRGTSEVAGTGLGLAIADSVVRLTDGTWAIGEAPLGGARMEVSWRRVADHSRSSPRSSLGAVKSAGGLGDESLPLATDCNEQEAPASTQI